jgi:ABC-type amino acid transport substrate-binding protein
VKKLYFLLFCLLLLCAFPSSAALAAEEYFATENPVTVRVGIYENAPKIFTDNDGNASGFWAEITEYIARQEGWNLEAGCSGFARKPIDIDELPKQIAEYIART